MAEYRHLNCPLITTDDIHYTILHNLESKETKDYLEATLAGRTEEERSAFKQGMLYATILLNVKCFEFYDNMLNSEDIENYIKHLEKFS